MKTLFLSSALFGAVALAHAAPVTLSTAQCSGADTSVRGGELSTRSFGALDILRVRNSANVVSARKAYLRFDLSALPSPIQKAKSATLSLSVGTAEGTSAPDKIWTFEVFGLKDRNAGEEWSEKTTTWDDAPANDAKSAFAFSAEAESLGTFTLRGKGEEGQNVTLSSPELLHFLQSDTNGKATLLLSRREVGDGNDSVVHVFASKENTKWVPPTLSIDFGEGVTDAGATAPTRQGALRVFVIGNSFSQNATQFLPQIAREQGHELTLGKAEAPSHSLQMHWEGVEADRANPNDTKGKLYGGKSLRELLSAGTWDIVTIQQGSFPSGDISSYQPYAQKLRDFIKTLQPKAEVVMHQTWAYRSDASQFAALGNGQTAKTDKEMWQKSRAAYHQVASELGLRLIPVGDAFWRAANDPRWGFNPDPNQDISKITAPTLPDQKWSLHAGYSWQNGRLELDARHASAAGCYLGALIWDGVLFGDSPTKVSFVPSGVSTDYATFLRGVAAQTVSDETAVKP